MDLCCERCRAPIPATDVDLRGRLARCRRCNAVFDVGRQIGGAGYDPVVAARAPVPMPPGLRILEDTGSDEGTYRASPGLGNGRLVIERRWYSAMLYFVVVFCIVWNGFLANWYLNVAGTTGGAMVFAMLVPLVHVAVGGGMAYATIAGFVNKTTIRVDAGMLSVRHAPMPWPGNRQIPIVDLAQLFCEEMVRHGRNGTSSTFNLSAVLRDGRKVTLLSSLHTPDQALFLEQRIEAKLGIVDAPVSGEYRA